MSGAVQSFRAAILAAMPDADVPEVIEPGRWHRFSRGGRRGDTAGWCRLFDDRRGGVFGCHRQQFTDQWTDADKGSMTAAQRIEHARQVLAATAEREAQQRQHWANNAQRIAKVWAECVPLVPGDPVTLYLKRRGLGGVWPLPAVLRLHRALPYWDGTEKLGVFPAMLAPLVLDGRTVALHRTYLTRDGRKAEVPTVKKVTGAAGLLAGACIPLHEPSRARVLGIAEGIETALAAWCASTVPTVAAYCADNLAAWRWPAGLRRLVIFADADKAGAEAADKLLSRAVRAGLQASVMTPTDQGADWCDVWAARGAVGAAT